MTNNEIVEKLAKNKEIEKMIINCAKCSNPWFDDLANDLYLDLMTKKDGFLQELEDKNQLNFFLSRMVMNNIVSKNSPFYTNYMKWEQRRSELYKDICE